MIRRGALENLSRLSLVAAFCALVATVCTAGAIAQRPPPVMTAVAFVATSLPLPTATLTLTPTPMPPPIALLAGHSGGADTGAICPDGLREVDINVDIANRTKLFLEARGYQVEVLAEFDRRLNATKRDYTPRVFLAIHADSCIMYASGYKVARAEFSAISQEDDRLVRCVSSAYAAATQLAFHEGSITRDMTHYHALNEINSNTPGAIIELGFLGADKKILKERRDALALGIADGLDRFAQGGQCQ
ncbi:MAG: N-acetylmuramoyl-L-alanine amidase [Chloroflexi bacterium]|nr:N-acetylmuramoyl-L-alanine amidase [Chloroflexota bacterium]